MYRISTGPKSSSGRSSRKKKGESSTSAKSRKNEGSSSQSPAIAVSRSDSTSTSDLSAPLDAQPSSSGPSIPSVHDSKSQSPPILPPLTEENFSVASSSYASSSAASNYSTEVEGTHHSFAQDAFEVQNQLNALFSNEMFDKFFNSVMAPDSSSSSGIVHNTSNARDEFANGSYAPDHNFPWVTADEESQPFMAAMHSYEFDPYLAMQGGMMEPPQGSMPINANIPVGQSSTLPKSSTPQPAELQYYRAYTFSYDSLLLMYNHSSHVLYEVP